MSSKKQIVTSTVSQQILDRTPMRALVFLRGTSIKSIRAILQRAGYEPHDHNEGWRLLKESCGFFGDDAVVPMTDEVSDAIKQLDAWDEGGFRRARAALSRLHPEQCDFVFRGGLVASQGLPAVMGVLTFLDRLDELEKSPERKATRKADAAAIETLAKRGIDQHERARLRKLVKAVQSSPDVVADVPDVEDAKQAALVELRGWFEDWADTARSVVTRRDYLIRLGLAKRKANGSTIDVGNDEPAPGVADVPPAAAAPAGKEVTKPTNGATQSVS